MCTGKCRGVVITIVTKEAGKDRMKGGISWL